MYNALIEHFHELRTQLFQTELQLQQANPTTPEWNDALLQMQKVLAACADCTAFAETHLYPLADQYEPALVDLLRQQQRNIMAQHLAVGLAALPPKHEGREVQVATQKLRDAFDSVVLAHMQYLMLLQKNLLPVLLRYYDLAELQPTLKHLHHNNKQIDQPISTRKVEADFRSQLFRAENEANKAAASQFSSQQVLAMHY